MASYGERQGNDATTGVTSLSVKHHTECGAVTTEPLSSDLQSIDFSEIGWPPS